MCQIDVQARLLILRNFSNLHVYSALQVYWFWALFIPSYRIINYSEDFWNWKGLDYVSPRVFNWPNNPGSLRLRIWNVKGSMQKLAPNMKLVSTFKYLHRLHHNQTENTETTCHMVMAIRAVEFSNGGYKFRKVSA